MLTFSEAFDRITTFKSTGVLYERTSSSDDEETGFADRNFKELPPSKIGFKADLLSLICVYYYEVREETTHLPRKKKKKLAMHYKKKYNKLKRILDAMEEI
jgi:hypothetical protein